MQLLDYMKGVIPGLDRKRLCGEVCMVFIWKPTDYKKRSVPHCYDITTGEFTELR